MWKMLGKHLTFDELSNPVFRWFRQNLLTFSCCVDEHKSNSLERNKKKKTEKSKTPRRWFITSKRHSVMICGRCRLPSYCLSSLQERKWWRKCLRYSRRRKSTCTHADRVSMKAAGRTSKRRRRTNRVKWCKRSRQTVSPEIENS